MTRRFASALTTGQFSGKLKRFLPYRFAGGALFPPPLLTSSVSPNSLNVLSRFLRMPSPCERLKRRVSVTSSNCCC
jgi:hypothetical protein